MRERRNANRHQTLYLFLGFLFLFLLSFSLGVIVGKGLGNPGKTEIAKLEKSTEPSGKEVAKRERISDEANEEEPPEEQTSALTKQGEAPIEVKEIVEEPMATPITTPAAPEEKGAEQTAVSAKPAETNVETQAEALTPQELAPIPEGKEEKKETEALKEVAKPKEEIEALPKIDPEGKYTVQVGSFQDEKKAKELLEALRSRGYPVFLKQVDIPGSGTWYRTRIGTFKTREDARLYSNNIKNREPDIVQLAFVTLND
jgi:cell division septation protein DedD